jgi:hypothetical protein
VTGDGDRHECSSTLSRVIRCSTSAP